jgi:hypothetical protein
MRCPKLGWRSCWRKRLVGGCDLKRSPTRLDGFALISSWMEYIPRSTSGLTRGRLADICMHDLSMWGPSVRSPDSQGFAAHVNTHADASARTAGPDSSRLERSLVAPHGAPVRRPLRRHQILNLSSITCHPKGGGATVRSEPILEHIPTPPNLVEKIPPLTGSITRPRDLVHSRCLATPTHF